MSGLERTFDPSRLQRIIEHPSVTPHVTRNAILGDVSPLIADKGNVCLMNEHGGFLFVRLDHGTYEVHTQFLPEGRGISAVRAAKEAALWMFTHTDCMEILTKVPEGNRGAKRLAQSVDFALEHKGVIVLGGARVATEFYALRFEEWFKFADGLVERGRTFHDQLQAAGAEPDHDEDDWHNRAAGFALRCLDAGQMGKGVMLYNRWAAFYGYLPVRVLSVDPPILGFDDGLVFSMNAGEPTCQ